MFTAQTQVLWKCDEMSSALSPSSTLTIDTVLLY